MDPKNLDLPYFFKLVGWIVDKGPGSYPISTLSKDLEKFESHLEWYNLCRPEGFHGARIEGGLLVISSLVKFVP